MFSKQKFDDQRNDLLHPLFTLYKRNFLYWIFFLHILSSKQHQKWHFLHLFFSKFNLVHQSITHLNSPIGNYLFHKLKTSKTVLGEVFGRSSILKTHLGDIQPIVLPHISQLSSKEEPLGFSSLEVKINGLILHHHFGGMINITNDTISKTISGEQNIITHTTSLQSPPALVLKSVMVGTIDDSSLGRRPPWFSHGGLISLPFQAPPTLISYGDFIDLQSMYMKTTLLEGDVYHHFKPQKWPHPSILQATKCSKMYSNPSTLLHDHEDGSSHLVQIDMSMEAIPEFSAEHHCYILGKMFKIEENIPGLDVDDGFFEAPIFMGGVPYYKEEEGKGSVEVQGFVEEEEDPWKEGIQEEWMEDFAHEEGSQALMDILSGSEMKEEEETLELEEKLEVGKEVKDED